ncbi:MAG: hypothetical protein KBS46_06025 [Clostridiales bacterium]|nr:hypothetical protein [Candidatus Apopatocola equi]
MKICLEELKADWRALSPGRRVAALFLLALLLAQFTVLCIYNATMLPARADYDSSSDYLRAAVMAEQKRLMPERWADTTMLHLDGPVLPASLLIRLGMGLFPAFACCDILLLLCLLLLAARTLRGLGAELPERLLGLCALLCPWIRNYNPNNDLSYFSCMLSGAGYYLGLFVIFFAVLLPWLKASRGRSAWLTAAGAAALCFLSGLSRGVYLSMILLVPMLLFALLNGTGGRSVLLPLLCLVFSLAGKWAAQGLLGFTTAESGLHFCDASGLSENLQALLDGFFLLCGAFPGDAVILSLDGVPALGGIAASVLLLCAGISGAVRSLRALLREQAGKEELPGFLFLWNCAILAFSVDYYTASGETELRYSIVLLLCCILCLPAMLAPLSERIRLLAPPLLGAALLLHCLSGDAAVFQAGNDGQFRADLAAYCTPLDAPVVYYSLSSDTAAFCSVRVQRALDRNHIYRDIVWNGIPMLAPCWNDGHYYGGFFCWGDTTDFSSYEEYEGSVYLLCAPGDYFLLPEGLRGELRLTAVLNRGIMLYRAERNVFPPDFPG